VGHKFSLVLSREISDGEAATLREAGCAAAVFATDSLPTNAEVTVTKMDFDDTVSPSLAEAIESALEAVLKMPDLSVPGLTVPAQPAKAAEGEPGKKVEGEVIEGTVVDEKPSARKARAKAPRTRKTAASKAVDEPVVVTANGHADTADADLVEVAAES
jgi:hypothetical protein